MKVPLVVVVPEELEPLGVLPAVTPLELELELELELDVAPEELEPLGEPPEELLEVPSKVVAAVVTPIVAAAGEPKLAPPWTLVSAKPKSLPLAPFRTGTVTVFAPISPSLQLTVPLVAT